jgi:hypothetical protein
MLTENA